MLKFFFQLFQAVKAGEQLANVEIWKNRQATVNLVMVLVGLVVTAVRIIWPEILISDEQLLAISTGIATILGGINSYLTVATTRKIGMKNNG